MSRAILLVDHGSRHDPANRQLSAVAELLAPLVTPARVYACHMELAEPSLAAAFAAAVADGANEVLIHPYFLAPGRHSTRDIPALAAAAAAEHPGVRWCVSAPLGLHVKLAEVIAQRLAEPPLVGSLQNPEVLALSFGSSLTEVPS